MLRTDQLLAKPRQCRKRVAQAWVQGLVHGEEVVVERLPRRVGRVGPGDSGHPLCDRTDIGLPFESHTLRGKNEPSRDGSLHRMAASEGVRTLAEDLLARASEDWVTAAEVIDLVRKSGAENPEDLRDLSVGLIARLVISGLLVPGEYNDSSHRAWDCSPAESIARITEEWNARTDPFVMPGEIVWLDTSVEGLRLGEAVLRRESE